jgi:hypothetical protein
LLLAAAPVNYSRSTLHLLALTLSRLIDSLVDSMC